ncbi:methyl-accepting chemotaxis protein [Bacillus sp. Bva_UNVM-123]|uniref:methyl-accepting chemotaxis protein n=1 Tax=Bacillus sp. Bva_UNVM-123 TaxID=2829798 RepID=UPI00391EE693
MNLNVGKKLILGFGILLLLIVLFAGVSIERMYSMQGKTTSIVDTWLPGVEQINSIGYQTEHVLTLTLRYIQSNDEQEKNMLTNERLIYIKKAEETMQTYANRMSLKEDKDNFADLEYKWKFFLNVNDKSIQLSDKHKEEFAYLYFKKGAKAFDSMKQNLDELVVLNKSEANHAGISSKKVYEQTLIIIIVSIFFALVIGIIATIVITRNIARPLRLVTERIDEIAKGNLSVEEIHIKNKDEIGILAKSVNEMKNGLQSIVTKVVHISGIVNKQSNELSTSSNEVKIGSQQIANTMHELAGGTEEQASSSVEAAKAIEMFNVEINEADLAGQKLKNASSDILDKAQQGKDLMDKSVQQIEEISHIVSESMEKVMNLDEKNEDIYGLVNVIQDVSAQTNLLALNAAIEAARAGEHGKGFAVVADEVRKLAEQVTKSVSDITVITQGIQKESKLVVETLQNGVRKTEIGNQQIKRTGETFGNITEYVSAMVDMIDQVSANLNKMKQESEKLTSFSEEISAVSEQSAAGVEQVSAAAGQQAYAMDLIAQSSDALKELSQQLEKLVQHFRI